LISVFANYLCAVHKATRILVFLALICAISANVQAQTKANDSTGIKKLDPRKATIYSAICPGLGQIYNHKAWKAVIVYAGLAGVTYGYIFNQAQYKSYQHAVDLRFDTLTTTIDTKYPDLTDGTVQSLRDYHRRNRDIFILAFFGLYALNIIDANVDAHLQEFSINKDLTLRWQPTMSLGSATTRPTTGIHLKLTF
jgi:hypothetical protein